jgi:hypothetical protein
MLQAGFGHAAEKNTARFKLLTKLAMRMGFRLVNKDVIWHRDEEFRQLIWRFDPNYSKVRARHYTLHELAKSVVDIPGDTAECGVYRGASRFLVLNTTLGRCKTHYLFDSFKGLSDPTLEDRPDSSRMRLWQTGDFGAAEEVVRDNLASFANVCFMAGWIPERFAEVADRRFSLVHIDVDLYQPTLDSVSFFYERLNPGGILVCDDYGFGTCPGAYRAMNEALEDKPESIVHLPTGQGLITKQ